MVLAGTIMSIEKDLYSRPPQTESQFKHKERKMQAIMDKWLDDQFQGRGNYNPFFKMLEEIVDEPPYIPPVRFEK